MKTLALFFAFITLHTLNAQQTPKDTSGITIDVVIENITNNNGKVLLSLNTKDTFMKGMGIMNLQSDIKDGKIHVQFTNVQPGEYAIVALHDENNNKRMDFDTGGMPMESYGMSNNEMTYGPPQFSDAKFIVENKDLALNIRF
ncbi:DUF2141 domain-containing protein [Galbibacter pacificus]|uniref:DUF2141 domain-containing protein n=1 Tax=Galbibacter pacificus TaxID=2996052 RepID=A0ABT6FRH0_9FLAO|nr:DUF2141 domain-containing protein [Galbibacter pacificus]MDG3581659.1 DUF2141 domain-containing protein [Galbibacter pacificus]MDG3585867.1 DUF2141 domain-containing protein [Galbibacter pacificus]